MTLAIVKDLPRHADGRVVVSLSGRRRTEIVSDTIAGLSELELFQRGGGLVDIVRDPEIGEGGVIIPTGEPRVRVTPFNRIYELATVSCRFERVSKGERAFEVDPPAPVIKTAMDRGEWSHIRPLDAMVSWPVLRPDGSVFDGAGYDARTRCYSTAATELEIPPCITPKHVEMALELLSDIVCDFPFEAPEHRSAWLSALLTILARPAIRGPVPMLIVDANDRGSGKTLLCDTIGAILTGQRLPRRGVPEKGSEDEWGKIMLGIGIGSYPIVLLDNVTGTLRSSTLDMVLTGEVYQGRVLGLNQEMRVPIRTLFMVSSNNAAISSDLVRRSLHVRLVSQVERPETRTGFKYKLPDEAAARRTALLRAAFVLLVGYEQAGRPRVARRALGSYESWSDRIQSAMIWAGLPDPVSTQDELREQADVEGEQLGPLLVAWSELFGDKPTTIAEALKQAGEESSASHYSEPNPKAVAFLDAVAMLGVGGKRVSSSELGYRIRKWKDKWLGGLSFSQATLRDGNRRWLVRRK